MKKFWYAPVYLGGRDEYIAEAETEEILGQALLNNYNITMEDEGTPEKIAESLSDVGIVIIGELTEEEYEENEDGEETMFHAEDWI